jgi:hypothetical protein
MFGAVVGVLVGALVVGVLLLMVRTWSLTDQIRDSQKTNTGTLNASQRTLDAVEDCTQPSGECFQRGQKRTAAAVGDINRVVILAAACSVGLDQQLSVADRQDLISSCVINRLASSRTAGP